MLSGIKFIPRDQLLQDAEPDLDSSEEARERSRRKDKKQKRRKSRYSDDSVSDGSESEEERSRRKKRTRKSSSDSESDSSMGDKKRSRRKRKGREKRAKGKSTRDKDLSDDDGELPQEKSNVILRKEMGLEWMTCPATNKEEKDEPKPHVEEEKSTEQASIQNARELNPYLHDHGGYPDEASVSVAGDRLFPSSVVGDGGASWRLKAWKRAKEQAARDGRRINEVYEERWGSVAQLAAEAGRRAAPAHAHLHAIRDRKGHGEKPATAAFGEVKGDIKEVKAGGRDYLRDVSSRHPEMKKPKHDNLSGRRSRGQHLSLEDNSLISAAVRGLNKFTDDGSFMESMFHRQNKDANDIKRPPLVSTEKNDHKETELDALTRQNSTERGTDKHANDINRPPLVSTEKNDHKEIDLDALTRQNSTERGTDTTQRLSANQLAAKTLQLRMKGKHEEAEKLLRSTEVLTESHDTGTVRVRQETGESTSRFAGMQSSSERKKREEDADFHLAQKIMQNKTYTMSGRADDEYDFDDTPSKSRRRKKDGVPDDKRNIPSRFLTQQERCQFCFENPSRPRHLVISIANFTYMMLPQWQPVVPGHCCILPMQHDSSTRTVDKNVWEELRNFKKCLLRMFAEQDKDVVFLETVIDLGKQRRHCLIDCIPVPCHLSKQAPLYFKKAIDEAEEEWGQHEMKKVLPTSGNLRNVIPENFSYFHVEFGLDRGFAHVIDDDSNFKSSFGLNVIRGMLRLPEEDMHRKRRHESLERQKAAVASFAKDWEPFDWTKQLG